MIQEETSHQADDDRRDFNYIGHMFGRQEEITLIESSYEKSLNSSQVIWLHGLPGVGKTSLVEYCLKKKQNYCSGRFECSAPSQPFSALHNLLKCICFHWRSEEYPKVHVGPEIASLLSSFRPEITNILFPRKELDDSFRNIPLQSTVSKPDEWGFLKLKQAVRALLKGVCKILETASAFPLILYLDDLQWADEASLEILHTFLSDEGLEQGLLFIGSYRDEHNLVENSQLLNLTKSLDNKCLQVHDMSLGALSINDIKFLIASLSNVSPQSCGDVAEIIHSKTLGNPYFATNLIKRLHENIGLKYSEGMPSLELDPTTIYDAIGIIDNLDDHFLQSLRTLPSMAVDILKLASYLGSTVEFTLLEVILSHFQITLSSLEVKNVLKFAIQQDLINFHQNNNSLTFTHDGIHNAFYHLEQSLNSRSLIHLEIGRRLLDVKDDISLVTSENILILTVNQLNLGRHMLQGDHERLELAILNFDAAEYMMTRTAFKIAQQYLETCLEVLGLNRWKLQYNLTLKVSNLLSSILLGNGLMEETLRLVDEIFDHSTCEDDQIRAQILRIQVLACVNRLEECLEAGMKALCSLGHHRLPKNPNIIHILPMFFKVRRSIKILKDEDILSLKSCDEKRIKFLLEICKFLRYKALLIYLSSFRGLQELLDLTCIFSSFLVGILCPVALFAEKDAYLPIISCKMIEMSLMYGLSRFSSFAFANFAFGFTVIGDMAEAYRIGSLALRIMQRFGEDARTLVILHGLLFHTKKPIMDSLKPTLKAYCMAFSEGDIAFAGQACSTHFTARIIAGSPLTAIVDDIFGFCDQLKAFGQELMWIVLVILQRSCLELTGRSKEIQKMIGEYLDDSSFENLLMTLKAGRRDFQFCMHTLRSRYYLDDFESAHYFAERCWRSKELDGAYPVNSLYYLFSALIAAECYKNADISKRLRLWRIFRCHHRKLMSWSEKGNPNIRHLIYLLNAEYMTLQKKKNPVEIKQMYDKCIALANRTGFVHDAALANERVGVFFLAMNDMYWAQHYLQQSKRLFTDWGAIAKVSRMMNKYGNIVEAENSVLLMSHHIAGRSTSEVIAHVDCLRTRPSFS
jgi:predicted ATPase